MENVTRGFREVAHIHPPPRTKFNPESNPVLIYTTVAGGDANHVAVAIGHPNFADFARQGKSNAEVLSEAYAAPAATAIMSSLEDTVATEEVTIARYRPKLSSTASGQDHL